MTAKRPGGLETSAERSSRLVGGTGSERVRRLAGAAWALPGPGVVTGASDDDPSGIATYSLTGAKTGYSLLWTALLTLPLNAAVQNMCARIGLTTGGGLATVLRRHYPRWLLQALVTLLFVANTVNIGADVAAVAAGLDLLTGIPESALVVPVGVGIATSEIFVPYRVFANYLKLLTLALFAYLIDGFLAHPDWLKAAKYTFLPTIQFNAAFITTLVAVLGTTISPYLFFWQCSEEVEEMHRRNLAPGDESELRRERIDVDAGMFLANLIFYFIILTTAATIYTSGSRDITSARDAAEALRPLAGDRATIIFALGFIGTGLLSIPVLAASAAYAVAEVFDWKEGLEEKPRQAPQFYLVIGLASLIGLGIAVSGIGAIRALFVAAVVNGDFTATDRSHIGSKQRREDTGPPPQWSHLQPPRWRYGCHHGPGRRWHGGYVPAGLKRVSDEPLDTLMALQRIAKLRSPACATIGRSIAKPSSAGQVPCP